MAKTIRLRSNEVYVVKRTFLVNNVYSYLFNQQFKNNYRIMEKYNLQNDLKVFGVQVNTFPNGVGEAFDKLMKMLPQQDKRPYYRIVNALIVILIRVC